MSRFILLEPTITPRSAMDLFERSLPPNTRLKLTGLAGGFLSESL